MKAKSLLLFLVALSVGCAAKAQSLYFLRYHFTSIEDTADYNVFIVRNEDGTGYYRVRFFDSDTRQDMLVNLQMKEYFYTDKNGYTDTTKLYFRGYNPRIIVGDKNYVYYPERFWFKLDKRTNLYEPWAVTSPDETLVAQGEFTQPPMLLQQKDLTEPFVAQFFLPKDDLYASLFTTTQRSLTPLQKQDILHLIVVANTDDDRIGNTCVVDRDRTVKMFKDLSEFLGIGFDPKVIYGNTYSKQSVQNAVYGVRPGSHDIVIFYYSGHGFNDPTTNRSFPNMALSNKSFDDAVASSMNIEDVYNIIRNKGARFNLVISDCCNNKPDDAPGSSCDIPKTRSSTLGWSIENCKALFMNEKPMSILMTAAQKGEESAGNIAYGGFFTNQFRSSLVSYFKPLHNFPNWDMILKEAQTSTVEQAENARCSEANQRVTVYKQHPVYRIQ